MTPAEIMTQTVKSGKAERLLKQYEAFHFVFDNPLDNYLREGFAPGASLIDKWGTQIIWPEGEPGAVPYITEENKVLKDIENWREYVHAPDLEAHCRHGWEKCAEEAQKARENGKLVTLIMGLCIFEQLHFLMGFEDTLVNLIEYPDEIQELIDYICDYRLTMFKIAVEQLHPDVLLSHDDWGTRTSMFMSPEMWREYFKEPYRKLYDYARSQGVLVIHHSDSYLVPIVEDMAEIGIQVWQGVLPENDIPSLQKQLNGRMALMGGIGASIDREDATEEEIRQYVRSLLDACSPGGYFIPCITYGSPNTVFKHVDPIIDSEIDNWNQMHSAAL